MSSLSWQAQRISQKQTGAPRPGGAEKCKMNALLSTTESIVIGPQDVLFGRGKGSYESQGNLRFQHIIFEALPLFARAGKKEKTRISKDVVAYLKSKGGRFLVEKEDGALFEVTDEGAREKVVQALRYRKRKHGENSIKRSFGMFSEVLTNEKSFIEFRERLEDMEPAVSNRSNATTDIEDDEEQESRLASSTQDPMHECSLDQESGFSELEEPNALSIPGSNIDLFWTTITFSDDLSVN